MSARCSSLAAWLLVLLVLAGCSSAPLQATLPTPVPPTAAPTAAHAVAALPAPADTLRWSLEGLTDLRSLDPAKAGDQPSYIVFGLLYGGLMRFNEHLEVVPDGASDVQVSADGKRYTFTVREGLRFADGTPVTANDFAFSLNRVLRPETGSFAGPDLLSTITGAHDVATGKAKDASGIRVADLRTLEITLERPVAYFLPQLASPVGSVVPATLVQSGPAWQENAYGTGPYRLKQWEHNKALTLVANEHYWSGKPGIPTVQMLFNPNSDTAFQHYMAGQLDIMGNQQTPVPASQINAVRTVPDFRSSTALVTRYIGFNNQKAPFDNTHVRRAFALATDRPTLVSQVLGDAAVAASRILPPGMIGTQLAVQAMQLDAAAAKAELVQAGYANGADLPEVTLAYAEEGDNSAVASVLQTMWQDNLGVKVRLQSYNLNDFNDALDQTFDRPKQGLQFYFSVWGADYPDPENFLSRQFRSDARNNNGHFSNQQLDSLITQADQLSQRAQVQQRLQLYSQAEQIAIREVGWLPLYHPKFNVLMRPRVKGLVLTPTGIQAPDWSKVSLGS